MKDRRSFTPEFKRRVVEESLSGFSTPAQVVRKHGISWGLLSHWKKRWVNTTDSNHNYPIYPDLKKEQPPMAINQVWVSDITYIRIESGFVYLSVILDAFSRRVIGCYYVSRGLDTQITLKALDMAICRRNPVPGIIPPFRPRGAVCIRRLYPKA